jgi:UDP-3-O-[3-hydroxymyristoyl] glucosamine N-acyltransferase
MKLDALAKLVGGELRGDAALEIDGLMPLEFAGPSNVSFYANKRYLAAAQATGAGAVIATEPYDGAPKNLIIHEEPYLAAAKVARHFHPIERHPPGVHKSAVVDEKARLGKDVYVGPLAVVEADATLEDNVQIHAQAYVGVGASVGKDTVIYPGVKLLKGTQVGERCIIHAGAVLGADGFGFAEDKKAPPGEGRVKVPQLGIVMVGDDVEIGANTTIDRATFGATQIGRGTKIDNLVQIAHNVRTGEDCVIVAQAGISGSTKLGQRVILAGQVGVVGHISLGDGVMVQAQSGINKSVPAGKIMGGTPAVEYHKYLKQMMSLRFLDDIRRRVLVAKKESD